MFEELFERYANSPKGWAKWLSGKKELSEHIDKLFPNIKSKSEKVYLLLNNLSEPAGCKYCGKPAKFSKRCYSQFCSVKCAQNDKQTKERHDKTCLEKYGVKNPAQNEQVKDKTKRTCLERFGAENIFSSDIGKQKIKESNLKKYGVENPQQNEGIKNKTKSTLLKKYGITCGFHNAKEYARSKGEIELFDFVRSVFREAESSNRTTICPFELDVFLPSKKVGIEYDGDYWHGLTNMKERDKIKDEICGRKGIRLLRVKESEWQKDKEAVKSRIMKEIEND